MANLLEAYKKRLAVSESVYGRQHAGMKMDNHRKLATAKCLENTNKFLNEAFENSVGTQQSDMGLFKKFCLNLTTVAVPNLIANELVIVHPMSSMSGYITYIEYTAGTTKGATQQGDVFNDPFRLGNFRRDADGNLQPIPTDANYTSSRVAETKIGDGNQTVYTVAWTPIMKESTKIKVTSEGSTVELKEDVHFTVDTQSGTITFKPETYVPPTGSEISIGYIYDNVVIPQNDIPIVNANMKSIPLIAKARRVAVYYSQIAAFQAKTDYGFDLGDQLAEKAVGQLQYEIDTEVTNLLIETAGVEKAELTWNKRVPQYISKAEHYQGFAEMMEIGKQMIYDSTKRFAPNYMLVASNILPILSFVPNWQPANIGSVNGPYLAGHINGLKVFVTPNIDPGRYVIGVNGDDYMSSAAVYAPYMVCVPTQLLQYADGGNSQGWSTMYDLQVLNPDLVISGMVKDEAYA